MSSVETLRKLLGFDGQDALSQPFQFDLSESTADVASSQEAKQLQETEAAAAVLASDKTPHLDNFLPNWDDALLAEFMGSAQSVKLPSPAESTAHLVAEGKLPGLVIDMNLSESPHMVASVARATKTIRRL